MKKLFTSTLLTVAAVPFLMAAPNAAAKKVQNTAAPAPAAKKTSKKHAKKSHVKPAQTATTSATTAQK